jgi:hypothetical protein
MRLSPAPLPWPLEHAGCVCAESGVTPRTGRARKQRKWIAPKQQRHRASNKATIVKGLLQGEVQFKCNICKTPRPIAKKSLKSHRRTNAKCLRAQKLLNDIDELTRQAPPPMSANDARAAARSSGRAGI